MQWHVKLNLRLNHYYNNRLGDQRIPHLQGCLGKLATCILEKCCNVVMHVMHTTIAILWPFASGSKTEMSALLKYLNTYIGKTNYKHGMVTHALS